MKSPYTKLHVHLVWATFDRFPFIAPAWEHRLFSCFRAKAIELKSEILEVNAEPDHVHLLVRFAPSVTISQLTGEMKGSASHLINHEIGLPAHFRWQGCYGAFTVSPSHLEAVSNYIRNQKEHHASRELKAEWEQCFIPDGE